MLLLGVSWSKVHIRCSSYLNITVIICESYCMYISKNIDKMDFLSLLIFELLFGVPCFGETAQLVKNHPVPIAGVPTPYHCGEFYQHIRAYFVTYIVSIKLLFSYYALLHDECH